MVEIQVNHLYKSYGGVPVLRDVTFTAGPGVTCVMAPSGAGKTTLLHILLGMESGDSGTITGRECRWAAVFQEDRLLEHLDAAGNLRFVLGREYDTARAAALLMELGLGAAGGSYPTSWSRDTPSTSAIATVVSTFGVLLPEV